MVEKAGVLTLFRWTPMNPKPGEEVTFTDDLNNINMFDFGDGHMTDDKLPVKHVYKSAGKYKVTAVSGYGSNGNLGTQSQEITVVTAPVPPTPTPVPTPTPTPTPTPVPGYWANLIAAIVSFLKAIFGK
jgi:PKD repeat protein